MIQVKQNSDIEFAGFKLNRHGIEVNGSPSFDQWVSIGEFIKRSNEAVQFWRGDWLNYGENTYDQWTQYFGEDNGAYKTLANEKWVSKRIPISRRREKLSWSHHAEVADLEPEEQDKMFDVAEQNNLSVHNFRKVVTRYKMALDAPELTEKDLEPTDPELFKTVQEVIDASIKTIELIESLPLDKLHLDARDFLFSHLKRAIGFYLNIVQYGKQKQIPDKVE